MIRPWTAGIVRNFALATASPPTNNEATRPVRRESWMGGRNLADAVKMGRSWQFFLTIAIVSGVMGYLYYTSDYYAERSAGPAAGPATEAAAPAAGGNIPSKE
jgi:hypothetical protein